MKCFHAHTSLVVAGWLLLAFAAVPCHAQQPSFTTARFRHELLLEGREPTILNDVDQRVIAFNMQLYLQGAVCSVENQELLPAEEEEPATEEEERNRRDQYRLEVTYSCELPGGPALTTQFLDFVSRQDVKSALESRGLPVLEVSPPVEVQAGQSGMVPTFSPVAAAKMEFAFFQQSFALHPGSTGFTPIQEMVISLEMQTLSVLQVLPTLNEPGTMDVACVVPQNGQQVTITTERRVSAIKFQCSFTSNTVEVDKVPPALVEYVNSNLASVTASLQQRGLAALLVAQPLQLVTAPTLAPTRMPSPRTAAPTVTAPTTVAPTITPTTLGPTTLAPTVVPTLAPTFITSVEGEFVQRFVVDERREGEVLEGFEQESLVETFEAFARAAAVVEQDDDATQGSDTVTCAVTDQTMENSNVEDVPDVLRVDYRCTLSSPTSANEVVENRVAEDFQGSYVAYLNDNLEDFTDELEGFLRIEDALVVRSAADATFAPSPGPPVERSMIGNYRQDLVVDGGSVIAAGRPAQAFVTLVENLAVEFAEDAAAVTTECRIDDQALNATVEDETTLTVEYSCVYSSFDADVSSYPMDFMEYVNDDLKQFTELLQDDVDDSIAEALAVRSAELMFATELPRETLSPNVSPTLEPQTNVTTIVAPNATNITTVDADPTPLTAPGESPPEAQLSSAQALSVGGLVVLLSGMAFVM